MRHEGSSYFHAVVDRFLAEQDIPTSGEHSCPYLPDRRSRNQGFVIEDLTPSVYRALLDRNFRRSGKIVYRPVCDGCSECRQIRVPVHSFQLTRSQRRIVRKNADLTVTTKISPKPTRAKWLLFRKYIEYKHDDTMGTGFTEFVEFLYNAPIDFYEFTYKLGREIIGVSIADRCDDALSSVYMFFDPAHEQRSLGTYSAIHEIEYCKEHDFDYYYLGYYISGATTMNYKSRFMANELLTPDYEWETRIK